MKPAKSNKKETNLLKTKIDKSNYLNEKGLIMYKLGDFKQAEYYFDNALKLNPKNKLVLNAKKETKAIIKMENK